ncbi:MULTISPECIES: SEC-C metal-binding domain-containing protein [Aeromonas]|nr:MULTISPECIES: SEC-C metal-binding domain-containing protein [Aeromonas]QXB98316.1 SEC-C domain-containing protein [Aeromonas sp. FDAARGOS 1418]
MQNAQFPAICDNCGTAFPSGFAFEGSIHNLSLSGNKSGPCPACGGMGSVPDGVFNVLGNVIEIIDAPRKTVEQLSRYVNILNRAQKEKLTREEVQEQIEKEAPELAYISDILPKTRMELYTFLGLLLAFLTTVMTAMSLMKDDKTVVIEQQIILEQTINNFGTSRATPSTSRPDRNYSDNRPRAQKVGRNEPCPCGSELKYKKCCLNMI